MRKKFRVVSQNLCNGVFLCKANLKLNRLRMTNDISWLKLGGSFSTNVGWNIVGQYYRPIPRQLHIWPLDVFPLFAPQFHPQILLFIPRLRRRVQVYCSRSRFTSLSIILTWFVVFAQQERVGALMYFFSIHSGRFSFRARYSAYIPTHQAWKFEKFCKIV